MNEEIRKKVLEGEFEFTLHAVDQSILRRISVEELRQALDTSEIIEDYPSDKYGPTCLMLSDDVSTAELTELVSDAGGFDWLDSPDEDVYSIEEGNAVQWPNPRQ